ncbi:MAG: hypothetical protein FWD57_07700 [Polyangiaceae bacterium]|nr:hypothetical protein [Polyangiaceae bacterium]
MLDHGNRRLGGRGVRRWISVIGSDAVEVVSVLGALRAMEQAEVVVVIFVRRLCLRSRTRRPWFG